MTRKTFTNNTQSANTFNTTQDSTSVRDHNAKCSLEITMSYNETANQKAQEYYNRASGCSVKAQEDNLFDYNSFLQAKSKAMNIAY